VYEPPPEYKGTTTLTPTRTEGVPTPGEDKDKTVPAVKPPEEAPALMMPLDLGDLERSDRLALPLPPLRGDEVPPDVWDGHSNHIRGLSYSRDGRFVVSTSGDWSVVLVDGQRRPADFSVRVWDARRGQQVHKLEHFAAPLGALSVSPGAAFAVFGHTGHWEDKTTFIEPKNAHVHMLDIKANQEIFRDGKEGQPRFRGLEPSSAVTASAISADRRRVVAATNRGQVVVWETRTGKVLAAGRISPTREDRIVGAADVAFSPDGHFIFLCAGRRALLFDGHGGRLLGTLTGHQDLVWAVALTRTPGGRLLGLTGGGSRQVIDGAKRYFVDGAKDYAIRLWDLDGQKQVRQFVGHERLVSALAFRPGTRHFLSGSRDGTVRLWDWESGKLLRNYQGHAGWVGSVAISPDGRAAVSGGEDCRVHVWQLPARAEDLLAALDGKDAARLQKAVEDMDAMGPGLHAAFPRLAAALGRGTLPRPLVVKALARYGELWRGRELPAFAPEDEEGLQTLLPSGGDPGLQRLAADGLAELKPQNPRRP
jgi:WD40 repeat protein